MPAKAGTVVAIVGDGIEAARHTGSPAFADDDAETPYSAAKFRPGRPTKPAASPKRSTITAGKSLVLWVTQAPERTV
jgi:hypothetical protein